MKIKLPTFRLGRSAAGPTSVSPGGTLTAEPAIGGAAGPPMLGGHDGP